MWLHINTTMLTVGIIEMQYQCTGLREWERDWGIFDYYCVSNRIVSRIVEIDVTKLMEITRLRCAFSWSWEWSGWLSLAGGEWIERILARDQGSWPPPLPSMGFIFTSERVDLTTLDTIIDPIACARTMYSFLNVLNLQSSAFADTEH